MDPDFRRRLAYSHSNFLREVIRENIYPRNPTQLGLLDVFAEKTLQSFRCTAEDSAEKKLGKYFEQERKRLPRVAGELSIVSSLEEFRKNLDVFASGQLKYLNWDNIMVRVDDDDVMIRIECFFSGHRWSCWCVFVATKHKRRK